GIRRLGQAENLAGFRIGPSVLEVNSLFVLDVEIRLMGFCQLLRCDSVHSLVNVHEFRHSAPSLSNADSGPPESIAADDFDRDQKGVKPWWAVGCLPTKSSSTLGSMPTA